MLNRLFNILLLVSMAVCLAGCGNKDGKPAQVKGNGLPQAGQPKAQTIAYVEIDSLMTQYQFCKDYTLTLTKRSESFKSTLNAKMRALQNAGNDFQQKLQSGGFASEEQAMKAKAAIEKQQAELQQLEAQLTQKFEEEQSRYNNALRDSIQHFLADYNKSRKFSMIISKAGDNILYADKALDITQDVITGLNKRYVKK